jgi:hypothetical protein
LPTAAEAVRRAEPWLRERQVARAGEVLIITGRGHGSPGGVGVVRRAIEELLTRLKRSGVVARVRPHTAGAFAVELASIRALFEVKPRARRRETGLSAADPAELNALDAETRREIRALAVDSLNRLGVRPTEALVHDEMLRQFAILSSGIAPDESDREGRLRFLISAARIAFEDDA